MPQGVDEPFVIVSLDYYVFIIPFYAGYETGMAVLEDLSLAH
jgi:hypothetical protein